MTSSTCDFARQMLVIQVSGQKEIQWHAGLPGEKLGQPKPLDEESDYEMNLAIMCGCCSHSVVTSVPCMLFHLFSCHLVRLVWASPNHFVITPVITNHRKSGGNPFFATTPDVTHGNSSRRFAILECGVHSHTRVSGFHFLLLICPCNIGSNSFEPNMHDCSNDRYSSGVFVFREKDW